MSADIKLNFRNTSGFVTDGAGEVYVLDDIYPTTRGGVTFGWSALHDGSRNRNAANDPRFAGLHFRTVLTDTFRVDLPNSGEYKVHLALGDPDQGQTLGFNLKDNSSTFASISGSTSGTNRFFDATGVERTNLNWAANEVPLTQVFSSTVFAMTPTSSGTANCIAHVRLEEIPAPTSSASPNAVPKSHAGNIVITLTGANTTWDGTTVFTPSGVSGVTKISQNVNSATSATVTITTSSTTGTLSITESVTGSTVATVTVGTATLSLDPSSGASGATPTVTLTGVNTVWSQETASGLFSVSGGTGASIATPTVSTNTIATAVLTCGSANGTLTITDNSTGATATFDVAGAATAYTLEAPDPAKGSVKTASGNFKVKPNGSYTGTITPSGGQGGTFTPSFLSWSGTSEEKTFTFSPVLATVNHTITTTNSGGLTDPSGVNYLGMIQLGKSGTGSDTGSGGGNFCPSLGGVDLLANGNWLPELKRDIRGDQTDPQSTAILALWLTYNPVMGLEFRVTSPGSGGFGGYGIPFNIVPGDQAEIDVTVTGYPSESDPDPYRVDPNGSYEGVLPDDVPPDSTTGDQHFLTIIRNETTGGAKYLEELYTAYTDDGGVTLKCAQASRFNLETGYPRPDAWGSTDAAGLPIIPLLAKPEEAERGDIGHTLRLTVPTGVLHTNRYEWPAKHTANGDIPINQPGLFLGSRLRLKESWYEANKTNYTGHARAIIDGLRKYGGMVTDITGGGLGQGPALCAVSSDEWDSTITGQLANSVRIEAWEVIKQNRSYTVTGPTTGDVGVAKTFTVRKWPVTDENYLGNIYIFVDGVMGGGGSISLSPIPLSEPAGFGDFEGTFTFTPPAEGEYVLSFNQGNQDWIDAPNIVFRTTGFGGGVDHGARMRRLLRP